MNRSTDYTGRQSDLCFLSGIAGPGTGTAEPALSIVSDPKRVTGVQKLMQRYTNLLITKLDSIEFAPGVGTSLVPSIQGGRASNEAYLQHIFAVASANALDVMAADDSNTTLYGTTQDDEIIESADLTDIIIDYARATVSLSVSITTAAGDTYDFIVPVK